MQQITNAMNSSLEGKTDIQDWIDDSTYRPRFRSPWRHTSEIVSTFVDEVNERAKHLPENTVNFCFRSMLCDISLQLSFALDHHLERGNRQEYPNELRRIAVKLNSALAAAFRFAGLYPIVPARTLQALAKMNKELALQMKG